MLLPQKRLHDLKAQGSRPSEGAQSKSTLGFEQLDPISKRIRHVYTFEPLKRFVRHRWKTCSVTTRCHFSQSVHKQCWMRLLGRAKIGVNAKVEAQLAAPEPDAATRRKMWRLRFFSQPENSTVKGPSDRLLPSRHRQLDVIESEDFTHDFAPG